MLSAKLASGTVILCWSYPHLRDNSHSQPRSVQRQTSSELTIGSFASGRCSESTTMTRHDRKFRPCHVRRFCGQRYWKLRSCFRLDSRNASLRRPILLLTMLNARSGIRRPLPGNGAQAMLARLHLGLQSVLTLYRCNGQSTPEASTFRAIYNSLEHSICEVARRLIIWIRVSRPAWDTLNIGRTGSELPRDGWLRWRYLCYNSIMIGLFWDEGCHSRSVQGSPK